MRAIMYYWESLVYISDSNNTSKLDKIIFLQFWARDFIFGNNFIIRYSVKKIN